MVARLLRRHPLVVALALILATPAPAGAAAVGLSDNAPATWSHPWVRNLGLRYARLVVPWDVAIRDPATVDNWLAAVTAAGMTPHVAFEHTRGEDCSVSSCTLPTAAAYGQAVTAFRARWPQVQTFTAWNEANHVSQPTATHPERAAAYFRELVARCATCTVVAGDVLDAGDYVAWLKRYLAASPTPPQLWGIHDYGDVTYGGTAGVDAVLATVPGKLWVEETGGIVSIRTASGRVSLSSNEARAARAVTAAFAIAAARPRIERMYLYQWRAAASDRFDAGLVRPDGTARPNLTALRAALAGSSAASTTSLRWKAGWTSAARRAIRLRRSCAPSGALCTGRVRARVTVRWRSAGRLHVRTWSLKTRKLKTASMIRLALPPSSRKALRPSRARRVRLKLSATLTGDTAARKATLKLRAR